MLLLPTFTKSAWTAWSAYGPCSATCDGPGGEFRRRTRQCLSADGNTGQVGTDCIDDGPEYEDMDCDPMACCRESNVIIMLGSTGGHGGMTNIVYLRFDMSFNNPTASEWTTLDSGDMGYVPVEDTPCSMPETWITGQSVG